MNNDALLYQYVVLSLMCFVVKLEGGPEKTTWFTVLMQ